ncbi:MAG: S9 family peptidase [Sphingomonadales bacterium]
MTTTPTKPRPPHTPKHSQRLRHHGVTWDDPYAWLRDAAYPQVNDPMVIDYLNAENAYFRQVMEPHAALVETIFAELKGRLKADDESVPLKDGDYFYQWRFAPGAEYRHWLRWPVAGGAPVVLLDEVARAEGQPYYRLASLEVSPDGGLMAFAEDRDGSERYGLHVKDLAADRLLDLAIANTSGAVVWAADGRSFFYVELSAAHRPYRVRRHVLGTPADADAVVYEEADESFFVGIGKTRSREFILIRAADHVTSELRFLPADRPDAPPKLIAARKAGREYEADHGNGRFFIRVNDTVRDFRVVTADPANPGPDHWAELIAGGDGRYIRGLAVSKHFLAVEERIDGRDEILIRHHNGATHHIAFPEAAYEAGLGANAEYDMASLRLRYQSMVTPPTVFDYDIASRELITRKVQEIPSGYDKQRYRTERLVATARDGAKVPISMVMPQDFPRDGSGPLHLYAYGAYGHGMGPYFSSSRISLLERGFGYAIAHIRGGDELGYGWYEDGKLFKRWNTFNDFIDAAHHLVAAGYAAPGAISISGGSAGGELMGVALNEAPQLWRAAVAHVPFVDVLNTMLDDSLPLTPIEWPEWGNPIVDPAAFAYIRSYSPYDNVKHQDYPALLVTAGLSDPRVTYWEPAKWVARLRELKTDANPLLLKTNMQAGHGGKSGRYDRLRETAEEYAFILNAFGRAT